MTGVETLVQTAHLVSRLREPIFHCAIQGLQFPVGSRGLGGGCSIGPRALLLAEVVEPGARVTGLDLPPEAPAYARDMAVKAGLSDSTTLRKGDVDRLPFASGVFDYAWSVDRVGQALVEPLPLEEGLVRVVKPGGTCSAGGPPEGDVGRGCAFRPGKKPATRLSRALGWFRDGGVEGITARTFAGDGQVPLGE